MGTEEQIWALLLVRTTINLLFVQTNPIFGTAGATNANLKKQKKSFTFEKHFCQPKFLSFSKGTQI